MSHIEKIEAYVVNNNIYQTEDCAKDQLVYLASAEILENRKISYHDLINDRANVELFYKEMDRIRNTPIGDLINASGQNLK